MEVSQLHTAFVLDNASSTAYSARAQHKFLPQDQHVRMDQWNAARVPMTARVGVYGLSMSAPSSLAEHYPSLDLTRRRSCPVPFLDAGMTTQEGAVSVS